MSKVNTNCSKSNPTLEAYIEAIREIENKAEHHEKMAHAYYTMMSGNDTRDLPPVGRQFARHEKIAQIQREICSTIRQMNTDAICDLSC